MTYHNFDIEYYDSLAEITPALAEQYIPVNIRIEMNNVYKYGNSSYPLFDRFIANKHCLLYAYAQAKAGKSKYTSINDFKETFKYQMAMLELELKTRTYKPSPYNVFPIRDPKPRIVQAPAFRDRIVQHALYNVAAPWFDKKLIPNTFACREGKGNHNAAKCVRRKLLQLHRQAVTDGVKLWVVKADISKYFDNIDHAILEDIIDEVIGDKPTAELWKLFVPKEDGNTVGLPIGSITSQISANAYLNWLDRQMYDILRYQYYYRYMDDIIIITYSKQEAQQALKHLSELVPVLKLSLNPKTQIRPFTSGVDFCGYVIYPHKTKIRKRNVKKFEAKIAMLQRDYYRFPKSREEVLNKIANVANNFYAQAKIMGITKCLLKYKDKFPVLANIPLWAKLFSEEA